MRCSQCGSEWKANGSYSQLDKCPFCGKPLIIHDSDTVSFEDILKSIFAQFGEKLLLEKHKFIAIFGDIAPKMKLEKKILTVALDQNIAKNFVDIPIADRELSVRKTLRELEVIMSEDAINTLLSSLILALEWDNSLLDLLSLAQSISNTIEISSVGIPYEIPSVDIPNKISPVNIPYEIPPVVSKPQIENKKKDEKIEIQEITFFENDGNMEHPTMEGDVFLQGSARYIGVKVWIKKLTCDTDAKLCWRIYRENGTAFSKEIIGSLTIHTSFDHVHHSWGWADPGHWEPGRYKVVAYFKGKSKEYTKWFTVYPGNYNTVKKVTRVDLFAGGDKAPLPEAREYRNTYYSDSLRRLYFEISFRKIRKETYTFIHLKILDPENKIFANTIIPLKLLKGNDFCWTTGWGWSNAGHWEKGRYWYEISLNGSNVCTGTFDIL